MSIEEILVNLLKNDASIKAIVASRVYPLYLPQGVASAAIVYQQVGSSEDYSCDGPEGMVDARFQVTCWAPSHAAAVALSDAVRKRLAFHIDSTAGVHGSRIEGRGDIPYFGEAEQQNRFGKYIDVVISYKEI